jgi:hypothetical protein
MQRISAWPPCRRSSVTGGVKLGLFSFAEAALTFSVFDPPFEQGYGDLSPTKDESRYFAALMILIGVVFIFSAVAGLIVELTAPLTLRGRELLEKIFPQIGVDLDGSGDFDFFEPRHPVIYYSKNLLPSILLTVVVQLVSAAIFTHVDSTWSFGIALYHCFVTATTVGYGDVSNSTQNGRLWSCFHILISVAMLGESPAVGLGCAPLPLPRLLLLTGSRCSCVSLLTFCSHHHPRPSTRRAQDDL